MQSEKLQWQYQINHTETTAFKPGETVFLKSNPECPMSVFSVNDFDVLVMVFTWDCQTLFYRFPPQYLLQYCYAGLVTDSEGRFEISLN